MQIGDILYTNWSNWQDTSNKQRVRVMRCRQSALIPKIEKYSQRKKGNKEKKDWIQAGHSFDADCSLSSHRFQERCECTEREYAWI